MVQPIPEALQSLRTVDRIPEDGVKDLRKWPQSALLLDCRAAKNALSIPLYLHENNENLQ
jgi:hypothetical protein